MDILSNRLPKLVIALFCLLLTIAIGCNKPSGKKETAQKGSPVVVQGVWKGSAQHTGTPNAIFSLQLNRHAQDPIWGSITSQDGTFDHALISDGSLTGSHLTFTATANGHNFRIGRSYAFDAKIQGNKMEGTWKDILDRTWGPFTTERVVATPEKKSGK